jgi:uncharacterized HAD superfamily protein
MVLAIIGFDIDDTVSNSVGLHVPLLNKHFNRDIKIEDVDGRFCDVYGIEQPLIDEFFRNAGNTIFNDLEPFATSVDRINKWYEQGHTIYFITARPQSANEPTKQWLSKYGIKYHELFHDEQKADLAKSLNVDLFVDDYPKVVEAMKKVGIPTVFMDIPKNRGNKTSEGIVRAKDWNEVYASVNQFLETLNGGKTNATV